MSITRPVFVSFSVQGSQSAKSINFHDSVQRAKPVAIGNGARWAFPQPSARRKKSDLPKIKRRLIKSLFT